MIEILHMMVDRGCACGCDCDDYEHVNHDSDGDDGGGDDDDADAIYIYIRLCIRIVIYVHMQRLEYPPPCNYQPTEVLKIAPLVKFYCLFGNVGNPISNNPISQQNDRG